MSQREARWVKFPTDFDNSIYHQQGHENVADPLSRLPDPQVNALEFVLDIQPDVAKEISEGYFEDRKLAPIIKRLENSVEDSLHDCYF